MPGMPIPGGRGKGGSGAAIGMGGTNMPGIGTGTPGKKFPWKPPLGDIIGATGAQPGCSKAPMRDLEDARMEACLRGAPCGDGAVLGRLASAETAPGAELLCRGRAGTSPLAFASFAPLLVPLLVPPWSAGVPVVEFEGTKVSEEPPPTDAISGNGSLELGRVAARLRERLEDVLALDPIRKKLLPRGAIAALPPSGASFPPSAPPLQLLPFLPRSGADAQLGLSKAARLPACGNFLEAPLRCCALVRQSPVYPAARSASPRATTSPPSAGTCAGVLLQGIGGATGSRSAKLAPTRLARERRRATWPGVPAAWLCVAIMLDIALFIWFWIMLMLNMVPMTICCCRTCASSRWFLARTVRA